MSSDGRYRLVRTIASGGMAQVYEAVLVGARGFERRVAIKRVLPQHSHDPAMRRMFFDEAQLASRMHHGNIVQILDYGVVDECEFIAMEYVDGVDSNRAMRAGLAAGSPLPEGIALHIISQVADALHYAHTLRADDDRPAGIIHRDVAPDNVLLSWQGDVKLSDFGIALALGERDRRTRSGVIKGKRSFMAPEQALGHRITVAADVYALGVTLRALLASDTRPPGPVPVPDMCGASAAVVGLIDACTQHDPQARPAAEDIAERAGELVAATLGRDGRGALREWLEPLQPRLSRRSPFDEAFALALVPLGGRAFTVSRAADAAVAGRLAADTRAEGPRVIPSLAVTPARDLGEATARSAPRTRRHWPALLAALVLGGATAAAAWIWRGESRETSHVPTFEGATPGRERQPSKPPAAGVPRTATPELPVARPSIATNPVVTGAATRAAQPPPTGRLPAEAERQRGQRGEDTARGRRAARRELRVARSSAVPEPSDRGWLRVGGLKLAGARVLIDGRPSGYAPFEQELPAGEHRLVVLDAESGRPLVDQTVLINGFHTRSNPQRVLR